MLQRKEGEQIKDGAKTDWRDRVGSPVVYSIDPNCDEVSLEEAVLEVHRIVDQRMRRDQRSWLARIFGE